MRGYLTVILLAMALAGSTARAQNAPVDLRGIYVDSNAFPLSAANEAELAASLNVPGVDGLVLVLGWDKIETSMGHYEWSTRNQWMGMAMSLGKKVDLSLSVKGH